MDIQVTTTKARSAAWGTKTSVDVSELKTAAEMLDMAGLAGWNVGFSTLTTEGGKPVPGKVATVRETDGQPLGIVSPSYKIVQSEEAFAFADNLVDSGSANWERAGVLRGGSTVFGCMEIQHLEINIPGVDDKLDPYLFINNSFDGSSPLEYIIAYVRPVCINTYNMARATKTTHRVSLRHTASIEGRLQLAREALGITFRNAEIVTEITGRLAATRVTDEQVREIFRKAVWPISETISEGREENHLSTRAFENYVTSDTLVGIRGTAWGAYSAVTEFLDHELEYKGRRGQDPTEVRAESILFGHSAEKEDKALAALLKLSA